MKQKLVTLLLVVTSQMSMASMHCEARYAGKPFVQASMFGLSEFGPIYCHYGDRGDKDLVNYKLSEDYYHVGKNWRSAGMPGGAWCGEDTGGSFDTCRFAKREVKGAIS